MGDARDTAKKKKADEKKKSEQAGSQGGCSRGEGRSRGEANQEVTVVQQRIGRPDLGSYLSSERRGPGSGLFFRGPSGV